MIRSSKTATRQTTKRPAAKRATFTPQDASALASVLAHEGFSYTHSRHLARVAMYPIDYLAFDHDITVAEHAQAAGVIHAMAFARSGSSEEMTAEQCVARASEAVRFARAAARTPVGRYASDVGRAFFACRTAADLAWALCEAATKHLGWTAMDCMIDMGAGEIVGGTPEADARRPVRAVA